MKETWKPIPNYEGFYSASNLGRIRNDRTDYVLKPWKNKRGYLYVDICIKGTRKRHYAHHLIMNTFIGQRPTPQTDINHKDGIKTNNKLSNLEYVSKSENTFHRYKVLKQRATGTPKLTEQQVKEIRKRYERGVITHQDLANEYSIGRRAVCSIVLKTNWKHI